MLWELWQYATTRCPDWVGEMGYLTESISIASRYHRCAQYWEPHLKASKDYILACATQVPAGGRACVLGSGWLLDVPIEELSKHFGEVLLVDLVHPPRVKRIAKKLKNVICVGGDVSGIGRKLYTLGKELENLRPDRPAPPLPQETAPIRIDEKLDLVISVNLLSQLAYIPLNWIKLFRSAKGGFYYSKEDLDALSKMLISDHIKMLTTIPCRACLVTDHLCVKNTLSSGQNESEDLLRGLSPVPWEKEWEWEICPDGEDERGVRYIHQVGAKCFDAACVS